MPDEQGNFQPGFTTRGRGGEVLDGPYVVTELKQWTMGVDQAEDNKMRVRLTIQKHEPPDQFTYEHAPDNGLTVEIPFGRKTMQGSARILGRIPALVIEADVEVV
jgi:hypothetical protein